MATDIHSQALSSSTLILNNFSSPYFTGALTKGSFGQYSTVTLVYTPATIPTPWPLIAANFGYSLLSALYAIITGRSAKLQKWPLGLFFSLVNTIRSIANIVSVSIAAADSRRDPASLGTSTGRFLPPSQLGIATLSMIPYIITSPQPWDNLAIINVVTMFTCLAVATFIPMGDGLKMVRYGMLGISGGNCPVYVDSCQYLGNDFQQFAGCGWYKNDTQDTIGPFNGKTVLSEAETCIGILIFAPLILAGGWFAILLGVGLLYQMAGAVKDFAAWFRHPHWSRDRSLSTKRRNWLIALAILQILAILVLGAASIVLHMQLGGSIDYDFIDGFGPPRDLSVEPAGNSWVDCFRVQDPHDKRGFIESWWEKARSRPATYLGLS